MLDGKPTVVALRGKYEPEADDETVLEARAKICEHLDEIKQQVIAGIITKFVAVTDGALVAERGGAQYNEFVYGDFSRAELVGLFMIGGIQYGVE